MSGAKFVRLYPSDWRSGCIGLTLEQAGFYIRVCALIYDTNQRLPVGDDSTAAKLMGLHTNAYRKVRDQLATLGKLIQRAGEWTVPRADRELAAATNQMRGQERQADQNTGRETLPDTLGVTPIDTPHETPLVFSENANKINGPLKSQEPIANNHKGSVNARTEFDAPREATSGRTAAFADLKNQFNGATGSMLEFIDGCMGPGDNRANSERWLSSTVAAHGAQPVAQAFAMLAEKRASGAVIARPLAHWSNVAASLKAKIRAPEPGKRTLAQVLADRKAAAGAVA